MPQAFRRVAHAVGPRCEPRGQNRRRWL